MLVDTQEKFDEVMPALLFSPRKTIDVETNGLNAFGYNQLCGVGIATMEDDESFYFPFRHQQGDNLPFGCLAKLMAVVSQSTEELLGYYL